MNAEDKDLSDAVKLVVWEAKLLACMSERGYDVCQKIFVRKPWQRTAIANYLEL